MHSINTGEEEMSKFDSVYERYASPNNKHVSSSKICIQCKKEFTPREKYHTRCDLCMKKTPKDSFHSPNRQDSALSADYLKDGYFDDKGYLREGIYKDDAKTVASVLSANSMTPNSLRAFYNKLKALENRYKMLSNFDAIKPSLYAFERDVAYQVSRGVVPESFRFFITKNAELAVKGPEYFKGFVEHFLSVLAYFKDATNKPY